MPAESLPSSHAHARDIFPASESLERALKRTVRGEVRFDAGSRALYATDSSNYRQIPIGLVVPLDEADVAATIAACREVGAPVLPRGAGTSLAGQCCNVAVIMDFSKYMNRIVTLDAGAQVARVQPGIVLDRVRDAAEVHHLTFAPDPATHSRCTLGGMIGNNSCGVHALDGRQDRRQRPRARRDAVRRHEDDRRARRPRRSSTPSSRPAGARGRSTRVSRASRSVRAAHPREVSAHPAPRVRATTSTSCCPKTASTWRARSSAARARA